MNLDATWSGPGDRRGRPRFTWSGLLWTLIYPPHGQRILPTVPGLVLIGLAFGIGTAAYNSASNILFITLALLLTCLVLSGVLSWLNFRGLRWRLQLAPQLRAGHDTVVALELANLKRVLPTYGLWFEFAARPVTAPGRAHADPAGAGSGRAVRAALARAEASEQRGRTSLPRRLDPWGEARVEWVIRPPRRGRLRVELASVGSLFPFGFLRKDLGTDLAEEVVVWPAPAAYRWHPVATARRTLGHERLARAGTGGDLLSLRRYAPGDSHRLVHWKASARTGTLLVRQFAQESAEGLSLWLRTDAGAWPRPEQFELLVSFAASVAEDLFRAGRLLDVAIDAEPPGPVRRVHELERLLDRLAYVQPRSEIDGTVLIDGQLVAAA